MGPNVRIRDAFGRSVAPHNEAGPNDGTGISATDIAPDARIVQWPSAVTVPGTPGGALVPAAEPLMFPGTRSNASAVGYAMPMAKAFASRYCMPKP